MELLLAPENIVFTTALGVLFGIALLEGIGSLMGFAFIGFIDGVIPSIEIGGGSLDVSQPLSMSKLMSWLQVGRVPVILVIIAFLASFGIAGLGVQLLSRSFFGVYLPVLIAVPCGFLLSLPSTRASAKILSKILPKDETTAIFAEALIGRMAIVILGTASKGNAAEAKVKDQHGRTHYVMLEPDNEQDVFKQGENVLIVKRNGAIFYGITPTSNLVETEKEN
jgi:hypothetical protein